VSKQLLSLLVFSFLFLGAHPAVAQTSDTRLPKTIPLELSNDGHIFLRVRVNGSQPLLFGLDSGFEQSAITRKQAETLKLKLYGETQVAGAGENTEDFSFTKNVSFDLSGLSFQLREVGVLALDFPAPVPEDIIAGILGYDFISRFVVAIDFASKSLQLYNPRSYRYRGRGSVLPIKLLDNNPSIQATVSLPGLAPVTGMFAIDTGAGNEIFFNSPFVRRYKLLESKQETREAKTLGIGGTSKSRIGRATSIRLGRATIANPTVQFSQATKGDDATAITAGHIGNGIFRHFKLTIFDQARRRLILE